MQEKLSKMKSYPYIECFDYQIFKGRLDLLNTNNKIFISTINQYSFCIAEEDNDFKSALKKSDVLLPDGVGMIAAAKFIGGSKIKKIAGADVHDYYLNKLNQEQGSCFYMGSSESTLKKIKERLAIEFPNIKVGSYSPPFKPSFTEEDNSIILEKVNAFKPDVLFVGMTAPKQEKWSFLNKSKLDANVICSIGAVFDFYAGTVQRPNKVWINLGLEWLGRLIKEPKRMWKRYIYYGVVFAKYVLKEKFNTK